MQCHYAPLPDEGFHERQQLGVNWPAEGLALASLPKPEMLWHALPHTHV